MRDDKRKIVSEVRKMYLEEVSNLRKKRDKDLYDLCIELGGHDFWDWQRELQTCVNPELNRFIEKRICSCCRFREEREIEEEIKPTPTPEWLEKQFDIVENTVSQWSEEKQKGFLESPLDIREIARRSVVSLSEYELEKQKEGITESLRKMGLIKKEEQ